MSVDLQEAGTVVLAVAVAIPPLLFLTDRGQEVWGNIRDDNRYIPVLLISATLVVISLLAGVYTGFNPVGSVIGAVVGAAIMCVVARMRAPTEDAMLDRYDVLIESGSSPEQAEAQVRLEFKKRPRFGKK